MKSITVSAKPEQLEAVLSFVAEFLEENDASIKVQTQFAIAAEEIFVNIYSYAYENSCGEAELRAYIDDGKAYICFLDGGKPYNPLEHKDPDTSLGVEERQIGGLGIFMVKKSMDDVQYSYENGKNMLTLIKKL